MSQVNKIQLKESSILNVPLQSYDKDFTFIVNGQKFETSKFISDILSPNICKIHLVDPTYNKAIIETNQQGDFNHFLNLVNFESNDISENEFPFITEVIQLLGLESIEIIESSKLAKLTVDKRSGLISNTFKK